jgi:rhomboid-like protein
MSLSKFGGMALRLAPVVGRSAVVAPPRVASCLFRIHSQTRLQHNRPSKSPRYSKATNAKPELPINTKQNAIYHGNNDALEQAFSLDDIEWPRVRVRYLRPALWALAVSGGIFTGLAFLQARQELKPKKSQGWFEAPQRGVQNRGPGPPTPTELVAQQWAQLNPISKMSCGIIGVNCAVHLSSFVVPKYWDLLWHLPARNVNYTQFSSMFVHSGPFHLLVNMYATYNFILPVGYSRAFEGNPYHVLSFFLATGVLSGFAQHWATLIGTQKRAIPEIFIRCGGASGALLGVLGVFCMQYPNAGLGIMFVPVHVDAQYVLPAIMLFDFVGMVRGYSFVNFGHAVSHEHSNVLFDLMMAGASFRHCNWSGVLVL